MAGDPFVKLSAVVEIDETYVGGKRKQGKGRYPADGGRKVAVAVLVERGGRARAFPMEQITGQTMGAAIHRYVDTKTTKVMTDETGIYGKPREDRVVRRPLRLHRRKLHPDRHTTLPACV
jgi:hypothetical protein